MFRLLRIAFWLSIVILLLPGDPERGEDAPSVTVLELMIAARDIVWDISHLCERNPDLCATGGEVGQIIAEKARYNIGQLTEYLAADDANTLTPGDAAVPWQEPGAPQLAAAGG
ncbi:MAG: DUF5330 domain-containing protein [Bauldia sp.]|nr:DUF5330 domain-containing protein [Bauldia sp.]